MVQKDKIKKSATSKRVDGKQTKTAVSYVWVTVNSQNYKGFLEAYCEDIQEEAKALRVRLIKQFKESTVATELEKRLVLQEFLQYLTENKVDYVIVPKFIMLSKQGEIMLELVDKIEQSGAKLLALSGEEKILPAYRMYNAINSAAINNEDCDTSDDKSRKRT